MFLKKKWANVSLRGSVTTAAISCLLFLAACGGDSSTSSDDFSDSSSSVIPDSSSDVIPGSSSNVIPGTDPESSGSSSSVIPSTDPESSSTSSSSSSVIPGTDPESSGTSSSSSNVIPGTDPESSGSSSSVSGEQGTTCNGETYDATTQFCASRGTTQERAYKFVTIGTQTGMAENLNYETENSWCGGGRDKTEGDCATYGRLYTWAAAVGKSEAECGSGQVCNFGSFNAQGVCPDGWHVPRHDEWVVLLDAMGGKSTAGQKLKAATLWQVKDGITNEGDNGFAALPAGLYNKGDNGGFSGVGIVAFFWSVSPSNEFAGDVYSMGLIFDSNEASLENSSKNDVYSVRCLKD